jgi:hypothetical protein
MSSEPQADTDAKASDERSEYSMKVAGLLVGDIMTCGARSCRDWLGLVSPPHVADKILNHQAGTISGVASCDKVGS